MTLQETPKSWNMDLGCCMLVFRPAFVVLSEDGRIPTFWLVLYVLTSGPCDSAFRTRQS